MSELRERLQEAADAAAREAAPHPQRRWSPGAITGDGA
jgi:hypothetical protein